MMRKRPALVYGLICGGALTLYVNLLDRSGVIYDTTWGVYLGYLAIVILPVSIYLALNEWRKSHGQVLLKHSMLVALAVAFLAATIYSAYSFIDVFFFEARHLENLFEYTRKEMIKAGHTSAEIAARISSLESFHYSWKPYASTYIWYLAMGIFYGLIFRLVFHLTRAKTPH